MSRLDDSVRILQPALCGAALGLAVGFAVLAAPAPAYAEDAFYSATFGRVLSTLGLRKDDEEIDYRERPPLVLPNGRELPAPEKAGTEVANPAWPKDPDVKRRKLLAEKEKQGRRVDEEQMREENPLPPDQLTPGANNGVRSVKLGTSQQTSDGNKILSPSELGYKGGMWRTMFGGKDEDVAQFTGEPPRSDLTEPPRGYQTPSPNQPYGVGGTTLPKPDNNYETRNDPKR